MTATATLRGFVWGYLDQHGRGYPTEVLNALREAELDATLDDVRRVLFALENEGVLTSQLERVMLPGNQSEERRYFRFA